MTLPHAHTGTEVSAQPCAAGPAHTSTGVPQPLNRCCPNISSPTTEHGVGDIDRLYFKASLQLRARRDGAPRQPTHPVGRRSRHTDPKLKSNDNEGKARNGHEVPHLPCDA